MTRVFAALSVSVDGFITGRDPSPGYGLGDGAALFDWYTDGDTASSVFSGFHLSPESAEVFDRVASRVGCSLVGRNTYDDSRWDLGGAPHPTAPLVLLTHRPVTSHPRQTVVTTGIADAVAVAERLAGGLDVCLMGGGVTTAALAAGLVDELVLHQVPILLGRGRRFFQDLPHHVRLRVRDVAPTPTVTHLTYEVDHS